MAAENQLGQPAHQSHDRQRQDSANDFFVGLPATLLAGKPAPLAAQDAALQTRTAKDRALAEASERHSAGRLRAGTGSGRVPQAGKRIRRYLRSRYSQF